MDNTQIAVVVSFVILTVYCLATGKDPLHTFFGVLIVVAVLWSILYYGWQGIRKLVGL